MCYDQQPLHCEATGRSQLVQRLLIPHHLYKADYLKSVKVSVEGNIKEEVLVIKLGGYKEMSSIFADQ